MRAIALVALLVLMATAQVTVAPLFPLAAAEVDLLLVSLALLTVFAGRKAAMVSVPLMAVFLGFVSDRTIGLLVIAFLPFPLLAYWLEEQGPPFGRFLQTVLAVAATGIWARTALAVGAVSAGASMAFGPLVLQVLLPGMVLDIALLSLAYLPFRLLGLEPHSLSPIRERYR